MADITMIKFVKLSENNPQAEKFAEKSYKIWNGKFFDK
jgi:hypothetical protein